MDCLIVMTFKSEHLELYAKLTFWLPKAMIIYFGNASDVPLLEWDRPVLVVQAQNHASLIYLVLKKYIQHT